MKLTRSALTVLALGLVLGPALLSVAAWAQTPAAPPTPAPPVAPPGGGGGGSPITAAIVLIAALLIVIVAAVKLFDLRRRREAEAVHLQAQVSDALMREEQLFGLPLTPTARVPWRGTPAILEIAGQVPGPEVRERVLRIAREEATRLRPDVQIEDRMAVVPTMVRAA